MTMKTTDTLNWNVGTLPLFVKVGDEDIQVPGKVAQVRADNRDVIGITSPSYEVFQNHSLKELVYPLVDAGQLTIENMGYLGKGEKVFIQCAMAEDYKLGNESFKGMITLLNSHNGTSKLSAGVTTERIICSNTFAMAMTDMSTKLRHTSDIHVRSLEITEIMEFVNMGMDRYFEHVQALQNHKIRGSELDDLIAQVYQKEIGSIRAANTIKRFYRAGVGNEGKTLWDAVNGITQYTTHSASKNADRRFASVNFGQNAEINRRAYNVALSMV